MKLNLLFAAFTRLAARILGKSRRVPPEAPRKAKPVPSLRLPAEFNRTISREEIASLPIRRYEGDISVVNTPEALLAAMLDIRQERVVGFDTETRPAFTKGERYAPCLLQVATASRVYLLQLEQVDCAEAVAELLSSPRIVKSGVALAGDLHQLRQLFKFDAAAVVDVGNIAKRHGNSQTGLRNLAALFLGWRIAKGAKTTNWSTPRLSASQIVYAATDAWVSRELYLCFEKLGLIEEPHT